MRSGVVVAGGRSTRFGESDKALADLGGVPMTRRVADRLARVVDEVVVNCRADQRAGLERALATAEYPVEFAVDPEPDEGPMAGVRTGLRAASGEYAAVVSCDMPFIDPEFVGYLFDRATGETGPEDERGTAHDAAVPRPDEWYQPTQAVYRADPMADACDDALERDERKVLAPLDALDWVVVTDEEIATHAAGDTFENVNTPEEFEAAAAKIRAEE